MILGPFGPETLVTIINFEEEPPRGSALGPQSGEQLTGVPPSPSALPPPPPWTALFCPQID